MKKYVFSVAALFLSALCFFADAQFASANPRRYYGRRGYSMRLLSINVDPQQSLNTAFRVAAREGRLDTVKTLLSDGAELNSVSDEGKTALIYAAGRGKVEVVKYLLKIGADPNVKDDTGRTALIYATRGMCLYAVRTLLRNPKTNPFIRDKNGKIAADYIGLSLETSELFSRYGALPKG